MKRAGRQFLIGWATPFFFVAALVGAGAAAAADYLLLQTDTAGALLIDRNSVRREGNAHQAWTLYRYDRPVPASDRTPAHQAIATHYLLDCKTQRLAVAERRYLGTGSDTHAVKIETVSGAPLAAAANQSDRMVLAAVCAR